MKRIARWIGLILLLLLLAGAGASLYGSRALHGEALDPATLADVRIAPASEALTFARYVDERGRMHLVLVQRYEGGLVAGVDVNALLGREDADPVRMFRELGYEVLAQAAAGAATVSVVAARLAVPFDAHPHNIGIGANYREHARESALDEEPFVFPKIALPTSSGSDVARAPSVLLDYEVELGIVPLEDVFAPGRLPAHVGLVLCNELTDRWTLVRHFQRGEPLGTTGFVEGKSRDGFAVLGNLFVVPRDLSAFYPQLGLELYLNGRLRQKAVARDMVWGPQEILSQIFRRSGWTFLNYAGTAPLLDERGAIRAGTVIFSGTPAGVLFKPHNLWNPWAYLRPGDEVVIRGDYLGTIRNRIVR